MERRDAVRRWALMHRIWDEFDEMPGTSLTLPQASKLFGVPIEVCDRILVSLVKTAGSIGQRMAASVSIRSSQ